MVLPLQSKKRNKRKNIDPHDSFYGRPEVALLREKHWAYLQRKYHMGPRELAVAKLTCRGLTNEDIAEVLKMKVGTVKTHLRDIFNKTRSKNKITLLLRFVDDVNKLFGKYASAAPTIGRRV